MDIHNNKKFDVITVGSDPEFYFNDLKGTPRQACDVLTETCPNGNRTASIVIDEGNLGTDGASHTGELRPKHSASPSEHIENMKKVFREGMKHFGRKYNINVIPDNGVSVGGHIHIGVPNNNSLHRLLYSNDRVGGSPNVALGMTISAMLLPSLKKNGILNYMKWRLTAGSYGRADDCRVEIRGNSHVFEYRTPPAAWLITEEYAYAYVSTVGAIVEAFLTNEEWRNKAIINSAHTEEFNRIFRNCVAGASELRIGNGFLSLLGVPDVHGLAITKSVELLRSMPTYEAWKDEIEFIIGESQDVELKRYQTEGNCIDFVWGLKTKPEPRRVDSIVTSGSAEKMKNLIEFFTHWEGKEVSYIKAFRNRFNELAKLNGCDVGAVFLSVNKDKKHSNFSYRIGKNSVTLNASLEAVDVDTDFVSYIDSQYVGTSIVMFPLEHVKKLSDADACDFAFKVFQEYYMAGF